jgi:hypothetical protein
VSPVALYSIAQARLVKACLVPLSVCLFELLSLLGLRLFPPE